MSMVPKFQLMPVTSGTTFQMDAVVLSHRTHCMTHHASLSGSLQIVYTFRYGWYTRTKMESRQILLQSPYTMSADPSVQSSWEGAGAGCCVTRCNQNFADAPGAEGNRDPTGRFSFCFLLVLAACGGAGYVSRSTPWSTMHRIAARLDTHGVEWQRCHTAPSVASSKYTWFAECSLPATRQCLEVQDTSRGPSEAVLRQLCPIWLSR